MSGANDLTYAEPVNRSKGILLLGVWVILSNLVPMLSIRVPNSSLLLTVLGIVAGVLLLVDK
jgi:hypothetical protein